ncbi:eukaryotic translation initiation factor 2a [Nannochloropsis oceanica]
MPDSHPPINILLRGKSGVHMKSLTMSNDGLPTLTPTPDEALGTPVPGDMTEFCADGSAVAIVTSVPSRSVRVVDVDTGKVRWTVEGRNIQALSFSPKGTFLLTWERLVAGGAPQEGNCTAATTSKESNGSGEAATVKGNLLVWRAEDGKLLAGFTQKAFRKPDWPTLQWIPDESLCFRGTTTEIQVYPGHDIGAGAIKKFSVPGGGMGSIRLSPNAAAPHRVACFFPEVKGKPASVRIYQYPEFGVALTSKSFFKAQEAHLRWSPNGQAVLIHTHTDVDTSGVSYYGSTGLYLLHADGSYEVTVPLPKEGPISDAQWAPAGPVQFVVLAGRMPAAATLYNIKAESIFEFGQAHRNTVSFSPHGRFVVLAGFGNLAGEMDFWDRNKQKLMGRNTSHCSVGYGWSPCGRYFMTATLAPRMNVDNAVKLFKYDGDGPLHKAGFEDATLFEACFRPAAPGVFPDRPATPLRKGRKECESGSATATPVTPSPKPKAVYRPPGSTGALAAMLRAEREAVAGPRKVVNGRSNVSGSGYAALGGSPYIPGLAPLANAGSKSALKKKARKEKKKAADAVAKALADAEAERAKEEATAAAALRTAAAEDPVKRKKALQKKLKQIDELKARAAGGEALNEDQQQKLASENDLREQVAKMAI